MNDTDLKKISKQMSWILRHEAERLGLEIDPEGYVRIEDLVGEMRKTEPLATEEAVRAVVEGIEARKQRYAIVDGFIRANYGHSLTMTIEQQAATPSHPCTTAPPPRFRRRYWPRACARCGGSTYT